MSSHGSVLVPDGQGLGCLLRKLWWVDKHQFKQQLKVANVTCQPGANKPRPAPTLALSASAKIHKHYDRNSWQNRQITWRKLKGELCNKTVLFYITVLILSKRFGTIQNSFVFLPCSITTIPSMHYTSRSHSGVQIFIIWNEILSSYNYYPFFLRIECFLIHTSVS